jgi:hypothetical protein
MPEIIIRITVPEGVTPTVDFADQAPHPAVAGGSSAPAPSCPDHGPMNFKRGNRKSDGKPYAGYFCDVEDCNTKPVWAKA